MSRSSPGLWRREGTSSQTLKCPGRASEITTCPSSAASRRSRPRWRACAPRAQRRCLSPVTAREEYFALHMASKSYVDGVIAMAPGGDVANRVFQENLGSSVARAKRLVADGKGNERAQLEDYEGSKGRYSIDAVPAAYVTWFDTDGAMNMYRAARAASPRVPILWIVGQDELPALRRWNIGLYPSLPDNPLTQLYEPRPTTSALRTPRRTKSCAGPGKWRASRTRRRTPRSGAFPGT